MNSNLAAVGVQLPPHFLEQMARTLGPLGHRVQKVVGIHVSMVESTRWRLTALPKGFREFLAKPSRAACHAC